MIEAIPAKRKLALARLKHKHKQAYKAEMLREAKDMHEQKSTHRAGHRDEGSVHPT